MSGLPLPFCRAIQDGARIMPIAKIAKIAFCNINKISYPITILFSFVHKGGICSPPITRSFRVDYKPYFAQLSSSSSMRISWLYFAIRSVRDIEPVLICPAFVATARSAIVVSSVSPLRWEMITP